LFYSRILRGGNSGEPFIFRLFALFAALWRILQFFVPEKKLFARSPYEMRITVDAQYFLVRKFGFLSK
jgi:hypothetical protein